MVMPKLPPAPYLLRPKAAILTTCVYIINATVIGPQITTGSDSVAKSSRAQGVSKACCGKRAE